MHQKSEKKLCTHSWIYMLCLCSLDKMRPWWGESVERKGWKNIVRLNWGITITIIDSNDVIEINEARLSWDAKDSSTRTFDVDDFAAPKRSLIVVVGKVGCGKSTLLSAILGEHPECFFVTIFKNDTQIQIGIIWKRKCWESILCPSHSLRLAQLNFIAEKIRNLQNYYWPVHCGLSILYEPSLQV